LLDSLFLEINNLNRIDVFGYKLHPALGIRDLKYINFNDKFFKKIDNEQIKTIPYTKDNQVSDIIQEYNMFICDISAVVSECLAVNAPIFVYIPKNKNIKLSKSNMSFEDYTYTFSSVDELKEKLLKIINGNDYLKDKREEAMEYILGKSCIENSAFIKNLHRFNLDKEL